MSSRSGFKSLLARLAARMRGARWRRLASPEDVLETAYARFVIAIKTLPELGDVDLQEFIANTLHLGRHKPSEALPPIMDELQRQHPSAVYRFVTVYLDTLRSVHSRRVHELSVGQLTEAMDRLEDSISRHRVRRLFYLDNDEFTRRSEALIRAAIKSGVFDGNTTAELLSTFEKQGEAEEHYEPEKQDEVEATRTLVNGLDTLFARLGPPPDHLLTKDRVPVTSGGGGAGQ
ncbi:MULTISPECIES: hypothetical protein [unclassified Nonomuraea]|uniref:hypothetical protein n=1 Tax=unclassified Nonomuraea TaxID=2593643 RepID=UPI0033F13CB6